MAQLLIVEDDVDLCQALCTTLVEEGYTVQVAANGSVALERLRAGLHPDAILLDLMMPVMNGWKFRASQLAEPALASIPTIVMTASANLETAAVDADDFLQKPIEPEQLLAVIDRHVQVASWHLVPAQSDESCRWEDESGRWVALSLGVDEGVARVEGSHCPRTHFQRYEDALRFCHILRS